MSFLFVALGLYIHEQKKNPCAGEKFIDNLFNRDAMFVVDVSNFLDAAAIFFSGQRFSLEPSFNDFHCDSRADNFSANAKNVGIGVFT